MKNKITLFLPLVLLISVGVILYRGMSFAQEIKAGTEVNIAYGAPYSNAASAQYRVPADIFYTQPVKSVIFSHQTHAVRLGIGCNACHTSLFQMKANNAESQPDFNMKGLAAGKYCGSCHSAKSNVAFSSDTQCARCHAGVKGLAEEKAASNSPAT